MFARTARRCCDYGWRSKPVSANDGRGRFSVEAAAVELGIDPKRAEALFKPLNYTYHTRGQHYPAELSRMSRPGSRATSRSAMFPLWRRSTSMTRERFGIKPDTFSTF